MMDILVAILLGIVEGVTEFLPISSTGHLIVAEKMLGFHDEHDVFTVVVQLGAILAVIWFFRRDLWQRTVGLFRWQADAVRFWLLLIIGTIPAGIIGLLLDKSMERITTPIVVAWALIIGGIVLWWVERKPESQRPRMRHGQQIDWSSVTIKRALLVGVGQCVAIIPGVSRSGATIVTGLLSGMNRPTATALSFYLSIPVLVLASGYKLVKYGDSLAGIPGGSISLLFGLVAAFATALLAVSWLLRYVSTNNFRSFAYYRIVVGVMILALYYVSIL